MLQNREGLSKGALGLRKHYRQAFSREVHNVRLARHAIAGFAAACGFSDGAVADISLAAGEALSNAAEHGSARARKIVVDCTFERARLAIKIQCGVQGFAEPGDRGIAVPDARGRGFGIFLMRRLMDDVSFARNGAVVRLVRRLV
ncbi:MAG TPA: ATP-binding protein [Candidatus Babeliales bacterium]|nr:ATP-binding protein [Candidatus Babeliales bacterium]